MRQLLLLLLLLVAGPSIGAAVETPPVEVPAGTAKVGYLPIEGAIDGAKAVYFKRNLEDARKRGLDSLVVHLTTPGGELGAAMEMLNAALDVPQDKPRLIAFVDDHSLSAGSLIAYGHDEILVTSKAMLGDIGVITMSADGKIEYLPEKVETVVRTLLRNAAQNRGWDQAKLVKMTARTQDLYRFDLPQEGGAAKQVFVIEDDLGTFLAAHPEVKAESKVLFLGKDRLLSYTAKEAVDQGMATAMVANLDAVYTRLGVAKADVVDLSPSETEKLSWTLAGFAPLLAAAALLCVFMEFKMPMGGMWLALAAAAGVGFFVCQFYLDLASSIEVVLVILGLGLIVVELFAFPTGGLIAGSGALLVVGGLVLAFMPDASQFAPATDGWGAALTHALVQSLIAVGVLSAGTIVAIQSLPVMALRTGLADAAAIDGTSAGAVETEAAALVGRAGTVRTLLRPGGQVEIAGRPYGAVSENGEFLQPGDGVTVIGARFGELVVRKNA